MSGSEAKTELASPRKLHKQREQGSVPSSQELAGLIGAAGGLLVVGALAAIFLERILDLYRVPLDLIDKDFSASLNAAGRTYGRMMFLILGPIVGISILVSVVVGIIYNKGLVFAFKPVTPQIDRVSPMTGLKRIYGSRGWVETAVSTIRLILWIAFAAFCAYLILPQLFGLSDCAASCSARILTPLAWLYLVGAITIFLLAAGAEMIVQRSLFLSEQKMTKSEVKRERKEQSGAPEIRKERRRRAKESSQSADSIGPGRANMCFFSSEGAVAVRYHPQRAPLPRVTAKATKLEKAKDLRENIRQRGMPELKHEKIVAACLSKAPGDPIDASIFEDFAIALRQMFSGR